MVSDLEVLLQTWLPLRTEDPHAMMPTGSHYPQKAERRSLTEALTVSNFHLEQIQFITGNVVQVEPCGTPQSM